MQIKSTHYFCCPYSLLGHMHCVQGTAFLLNHETVEKSTAFGSVYTVSARGARGSEDNEAPVSSHKELTLTELR